MRTLNAALICALLLITVPLLAQSSAPQPPAQPNSTAPAAPQSPAAEAQAPPEKTVASSPGDAGNEKLHDQLIADEEALASAEKKHDRQYFEHTLADDIVYVVFNGWVFTKDKIVQGLDRLEIADMKMENYKFRLLGRNAALLTYDLEMKATLAGHELPDRNYAASVWENRDGRWQLVFHQVTPAKHP